MADAGEGMSKSAKKRAAKKARDAAHEEAEAAAAAPPPAAKAKAKAKAEPTPEPKAKAKGKAKAAPEPAQPEPKAKAKGKAKAQPEPPAPEPKAKAKGKAKAQPEPPAPEPAPKAKAASKQKAKAAAKPKEEEEEAPRPEKEELVNYVLDDGSGPAWETSSGLTKKMEKRQKQKAAEAAAYAANKGGSGKAIPVNQQHIVGMAPTTAAQGGNKGPSQAVAADVKRILAMKGEPVPEQEAAPQANLSTVSVNVPEKRIGVVIGPKGANIKLLQEKTGVTRIDTSGQIFTISGEPKAVAQCEAAIKDLVEKGYCPLMFDGFSENIISVNSSSLPDLIGKEGCIVRKIKDQLKVEVNFQDVGKGAAPGKKAKVTLAGNPANVEKAKSVINNIIMYGHDELTHPGEVHEEIEAEQWQYSFIIGKGGSELKHIQHNWKVKVSIPRDHSANQNVLVVGERDMVARAKAYIEKVLWNAENASKGRDRVDNSGDPFFEDEEEEPWMKQYMYRRQ